MRPQFHGKFSPLHIPSCALWLEADRGITTVSGKVSAWLDFSGNDRSVAQVSDANRPTYNTSDLNSYPTISFNDLSDQYLAGTGISGIADLPKMSFVYVLYNSTISGNHVAFDYQSRVLELQIYNSFLYFREGTAFEGKVTAPAIGWHIISGIFDGTQGTDATNMRLFVDGAQQTLTYTGTRYTTLPAPVGTISVGRYYSGGSYWAGKVAAMAQHAIAYSDAYRNRLEHYYAMKYGITLA